MNFEKPLDKNPKFIAFIHDLFVKGHTNKDIASKVGVSGTTINKIVKQQKAKQPDKWKRNTPIFDAQGRMIYNPEFHGNNSKPFTEDELEYICKFHELDGAKSIGFALERTEYRIKSKIESLKKSGLYEYYKYLDKYYCRTA